MKDIAGQLNPRERHLLQNALRSAPKKPEIVLEVGTWLGGGSTLHILRVLHENGMGHLWGIEADEDIYEKMNRNIREAFQEGANCFSPLFGFSETIIPQWLRTLPPNAEIDFVFLDGGNNPMEQVTEFRLLESRISVGGQLMAHDAKLRKGKMLVPYLQRLDNWECRLHDVSNEGLLHARKTGDRPSSASVRQAARHLSMQRLHPAEIASMILPASFLRTVLGWLPAGVTRRWVEGRSVR